MKRKFTTVTRLFKKQNEDIINYFDEMSRNYNYVVRYVWKQYNGNPTINTTELNKSIQIKFNILRRTGSSIISYVKQVYSSQIELKKTEIMQIKIRIKSLEQKICNIEQITDKYKAKLNKNEKVNLLAYRNIKLRLWSLKKEIQKKRERILSLEKQINEKKIKITFGKKKLKQTKYQEYLLQRDSQMAFVGCKSSRCCNQMFQLTYDSKINQFHIQLRKDFIYKDADIDNKYAYGKCYFNHYQKEIREILLTKKSPLTYYIIKRKNKYYLHCVFEQNIPDDVHNTRKEYGTIGVDFNKGFVSITEVNQHGNLVNAFNIPYRFSSGNKTKNDFLVICNLLIKYALSTGKDIVVEDLNFLKARAKSLHSIRKKGKKYNSMLQNFAYRVFLSNIDNLCFKHRVGLIKVNPAWTSWIAKHKYCDLMKLNIHTGASYVIARRGMGFKDKVKK